MRPLKPESPKPKTKDGTPKQCNCKHSKCLKLYCECFASGRYYENCNCVNCHNNMEHEASRGEAVEAALERNPNAFRPKIAGSPQVNRATKLKMAGGETVKRVRGGRVECFRPYWRHQHLKRIGKI